MNRQEILKALKNDNYYRNLSDKDFFDANNLDNLAKYLEHNFAKTDESKKVILDMLSHKKHNPNDLYNYRITQEELFNLNKKYYDNTYLYHGLNAYTTNLTDKSLDISEKIENNLHNIINNKDIELATSSTHMIGDIGIKGKGDSLFAQPWDMYSVVDKETGKRNKPRARTIITEDDIFDIIEKYHDNPKSIKPWKKHDEVIAKNFEIDSLWVKEDFYNNNQDFVLKLLKDNKIQNLDIIHSNSFEQYRDVDIERVNVNNINLKNNKAITNKNIRQELLELVSQTGSHAVNETDSKIASFLNGEISLSQEELETIKNEFTDKWFNTPPSKRKLKEYESYSLKEYFDLPDDEYDDYIAEKLRDKVSNRKDLTETFDITKDEQLHFDKQWKKDDVFKFSNGTSETRARLFLSEGKGYTSLQTPAFIEGETYLSRTGLQISMQGTDFESRSPEYAKAQSSRFKDRPVIIEGKIPAQYVYANQSRGGEFGIPHQYYDKISSAKILDAETRQELYHLDNGKLVKSDSFTEAKLPELKIKEENNIKKLISQSSIIDPKEPIHTNINKQYQELIDDYWTNTALKHDKEIVEKVLPKLNKKFNENFTKPDIYLTHDNLNIRKNYLDVVNQKNGAEAYLFRQNDILFLNAHGDTNGKILYNKKFIEPKELLNELENANLIPDDIKKIYTISCFGGLQKPSKTNNGIPIESSHTSNKPIVGIPMTNEISFSISEGTGDISENLKKDILRNQGYKVEEVLSPKQIDDVLKNNPQEAFDKYGPNDDRFYTSQGLDPKKQKEAINKLNSKRKPPEPLPDYSAEDARLDKMLAEDKAYIESLEKQRKRPNYKPVKGPKLKEVTKKDNNLDKLYQDKIDWINQYHPDLVESNEAKIKLYDYINDKSKKISFDDIIRANASAHVNDTVYHGMGNPFYKLSEKEAFELIDYGDVAIADFNLDNIIKNKSIELSVSNKPIYGDIGIKGKADIVGYFKSDIGSSVDADGTRHTSRKYNSKSLNDIISGKHKPSSYHEGIARDFNIESLWVKKDFYEKNKDQVYFLLKKHNIQQLDIIEDFEKGQIQTLYTKDLKKYFNDNVPISKQNKNLEKATNEVFDNFTENINNTPKPEIKNTPKPSKNIVKPAKNTSKMTTKSLGGVGKGAIGLIVAGITGLAIGKALSSDNDNKDKKQDKQVAKQQNISYNNQYIDNQYAMQMAQDISSYRYGKHMTGFVNF